MKQILLFPDPSPLVERLGRDFFRRLPERPGIYLMLDAADALLYVGKAKNLRQRLGSYRVANPDRMPRRHLRMLRAVQRIEIQECDDEQAALEHEARLLRSMRPKFNRAGTWSGPPKFLAWQMAGTELRITVTESPDDNWQRHGPGGMRLKFLRAALVRLLWCALRPEDGIAGMPAGWFRGQHGATVTLGISNTPELADILHALFSGEPAPLLELLSARVSSDLSLFELSVIEEDLNFILESVLPGDRHEQDISLTELPALT